jgi:alanine racemase
MSAHGQKTWIEISQAAVEQNIAALRSFLLPGVEFCATIKANAYGHDQAIMAKIAADCGIAIFAVDSIDEAIRLRQQLPDATIFILGYTVPERLIDVVEIDAIQTVYEEATILELSKYADRFGHAAKVSLKVETGLYRQGVGPRGLNNLLDAVKRAGERIDVVGIGSHFANAEEPGDPMNAFQIENFQQAVVAVQNAGLDPKYKHIACSAAAMVDQETQGTMVRFGIALYGLWSSKNLKRQVVLGRQNIELVPALSWKTRIAQIKDVPSGSAIGYGGTHVTNRPIRIAVLPMGYSDGYDRSLSNKGEVLIHGRRCPVLGIVCMNMMMVDVSAVPLVAVSDVATIIGRDGMHAITAEDLSLASGTCLFISK